MLAEAIGKAMARGRAPGAQATPAGRAGSDS
jgi:hypothetical protein